MNLLRRAIRAIAAVLICGAAAYVAAPADANHDIDFESYSCSETPEETPDTEPELTPPPSQDPTPEPPDGPTPAPQNCMPDENERIWGTRTIKFSTETNGAQPLQRIALYILSEEETVPDAADGAPLLDVRYTRGQDVRDYDTPFSWDSVTMTPYNGKYRIRVEADAYPPFTGDEPHRAAAQRVHLLVDNPPKAIAAPKIVTATPDGVTLQWAAAKEVDVRAYTVYRAKTANRAKKPSTADFKQIAVTSTTTYRDPVGPGVYWYAIKVTRRSVVTPKEGISSPLSAMSAAAEVDRPEEKEEQDDSTPRPLSYRPTTAIPRAQSRLSNAPDAPFAYKLPYDKNVDAAEPFEGGSREEPGTNDPRGPVLPVAVGMFLLSSALAVGRMPY